MKHGCRPLDDDQVCPLGRVVGAEGVTQRVHRRAVDVGLGVVFVQHRPDVGRVEGFLVRLERNT